MKTCHCIPKCLAIAAAAMLAAGSSCLGAVLEVPQYNQEQDQWCWNASAQMVLAFYGNSYSQTAIANWAVGGQNIPNYLYGSTDSSMHGDDEILQHFGSLGSTGQASALSLNETSTEIGASKPIMLRWGWNGGGGHIAVIHGVDGNTVYVRDPWPANGSQIQSYAWVCSPYGNSGSWTHSLTMSTGHSDNNYYQQYQYYYNLAVQRYNNASSYLDYAYAYYYYAYAQYYYYMYKGDSSSANAAYNYYMQYAQYYYDLYSSLSMYYQYYQYYYNLAYQYYYYATSYQDLAYCYYYYAYAMYYGYMYQGNSSYANYYYDYYMEWAYYFYYR